MEALCRVLDADLARIENTGLEAKDYNSVKVFRSHGNCHVGLLYLLKA